MAVILRNFWEAVRDFEANYYVEVVGKSTKRQTRGAFSEFKRSKTAPTHLDVFPVGKC